jgi:hypothetical protein
MSIFLCENINHKLRLLFDGLVMNDFLINNRGAVDEF